MMVCCLATVYGRNLISFSTKLLTYIMGDSSVYIFTNDNYKEDDDDDPWQDRTRIMIDGPKKRNQITLHIICGTRNNNVVFMWNTAWTELWCHRSVSTEMFAKKQVFWVVNKIIVKIDNVFLHSEFWSIFTATKIIFSFFFWNN